MQKNIDILVVDDEEIMRNLFIDILQDWGYRVTAVTDGKQAQDKAGNMFFQVAFVDVHMPVMNGLQTLRVLRKISPRTMIVMMDSFPDVLLETAEREGANCIHKPFNIKEVRSIVESIAG